MNHEAAVPSGYTVRPELQRLSLLVGESAAANLERARVAVIGLGGVGSWAAEALARSGIGRLTIIDNDTVAPSNINRQLQALPDTVGLPKAAALMRRLRAVNPHCDITAFNQIFSLETAPLFNLAEADYVIDAIDSLPHKLDLIMYVRGAPNKRRRTGEPVLPESCNTAIPPMSACIPRGGSGESFKAVPALKIRSEGETSPTILFSSMGMAQKLDPTRIQTADIWNTRGCPLARLVRHGLRERDFAGHFTAVYSDEVLPRAKEASRETGSAGSKIVNGSVVTVTASAGMILASLVIRDIYERAHGGEPPTYNGESRAGNDGNG